MLAVCILLCFLSGGLLAVRFLLPTHRPLNRIWLGLSLGLLLMMWLPALGAFVWRFSFEMQLWSLIPLAAIVGVCYLARDRRPVRAWDGRETAFLREVLIVLVPLTALCAYLQYTHVCRVDEWGNWNVGQSTYGDLMMHLSFVTGLKDAHFPADYPFYPGKTLSYPFLADSLSTSFYLLGMNLQLAVIVPSVLMIALLILGVMVLSRDLTRGRKTVVMATCLFFLNGGLGFLYDFDQAAGVSWDGTPTFVERLRVIMEGYYKTPTNQPDPNNLRWSNMIADLLTPQRTLMAGYCMVVPCLYLLFAAFRKGRERKDLREIVLLGIWGGALPLIHTQSFLALGLSSFGLMVYDLIHAGKGADEEGKAGGTRFGVLRSYLLYALIAVLLAAPQLFGFTFRQVFSGEEKVSFLAFQFNWVNNPGGRGMRDFYVWFYVKNIGLPFLLLLGAMLEKDPHMRRILAASIPIWLVAEFIRFQPNEYDNNKLFYLAYLLDCMVISDYAAMLYRRMKGVRAWPLLAGGFLFCFFFSAGLTLARECVSDYVAFSSAAVEAGEFVRDETEEGSVFMTGTQHLNPVSAIAGRQVVCGPDLYLYWHGISTGERHLEQTAFYEDPANHLDVLEKYGVDYVYVSSYERSDYRVDTAYMDEHFEKVFENGEAAVYRVPKEET
ncbi:MAG: hypothetical protein IJ083_12695 [Clostridia bacterium]|nr:hypothetical protein [Clostridia bacterium]